MLDLYFLLPWVSTEGAVVRDGPLPWRLTCVVMQVERECEGCVGCDKAGSVYFA